MRLQAAGGIEPAALCANAAASGAAKHWGRVGLALSGSRGPLGSKRFKLLAVQQIDALHRVELRLNGNAVLALGVALSERAQRVDSWGSGSRSC